MTDVEDMRAELIAVRVLLQCALRREWEATKKDPHWPDTVRVTGLQAVDFVHGQDPLHKEIRMKLVNATAEALS